MNDFLKIIRLSSMLQKASMICHQHGIERYVTNIGGYRWHITKLPNYQHLFITPPPQKKTSSTLRSTFNF